MNNTFYAFLLTVLAGLSTMLGTIFIFIKKKDTNKIVLSSLSFAAGVMICVSITDLIPESINLLRDNINNISTIIISFLGILLGIIISMLIDYYLPDKPSISSDKKLYKVGFISMIAIILHNIPEGCSCYVSCWKDNIGLNLKFKNYQDNLYYYFDSLFDFYKHYFNSSSIICFILSISGKNKFVPCFFSANNELKFSNISSFKLSATLTGAPLIVCG